MKIGIAADVSRADIVKTAGFELCELDMEQETGILVIVEPKSSKGKSVLKYQKRRCDISV